jgi:hypothetical protein
VWRLYQAGSKHDESNVFDILVGGPPVIHLSWRGGSAMHRVFVPMLALFEIASAAWSAPIIVDDFSQLPFEEVQFASPGSFPRPSITHTSGPLVGLLPEVRRTILGSIGVDHSNGPEFDEARIGVTGGPNGQLVLHTELSAEAFNVSWQNFNIDLTTTNSNVVEIVFGDVMLPDDGTLRLVVADSLAGSINFSDITPKSTWRVTLLEDDGADYTNVERISIGRQTQSTYLHECY